MEDWTNNSFILPIDSTNLLNAGTLSADRVSDVSTSIKCSFREPLPENLVLLQITESYASVKVNSQGSVEVQEATL